MSFVFSLIAVFWRNRNAELLCPITKWLRVWSRIAADIKTAPYYTISYSMNMVRRTQSGDESSADVCVAASYLHPCTASSWELSVSTCNQWNFYAKRGNNKGFFRRPCWTDFHLALCARESHLVFGVGPKGSKPSCPDYGETAFLCNTLSFTDIIHVQIILGPIVHPCAFQILAESSDVCNDDGAADMFDVSETAVLADNKAANMFVHQEWKLTCSHFLQNFCSRVQ